MVCLAGTRRNGCLSLLITPASHEVASYSVPRDSAPPPAFIGRRRRWAASSGRVLGRGQHEEQASLAPRPPVAVGAYLYGAPSASGSDTVPAWIAPSRFAVRISLPPTQLPQFHQVKHSLAQAAARIQRLVHHSEHCRAAASLSATFKPALLSPRRQRGCTVTRMPCNGLLVTP
jgi:hypothetical protein